VALLFLGLGGCSEKGTGPALDSHSPVALQVDVEGRTTDSLERVGEALVARNLVATLFVSPHFARLFSATVHDFYLKGFEVAFLNPWSASPSYEVQARWTSLGYQWVAGCSLCSLGRPVVGMRPAGFAQNEHTFCILDSLKMAYNAGFQARLIYAGGHEGDMAPYRVEGYQFVAVPVSTAWWQDTWVCLTDEAAVARGLGPVDWGDLLARGLEEAQSGKGPLVMVVHDTVVGEPDSPYWSAFLGFLDRGQTRGARFVTTEELVFEYVAE
ncbi:MAG: hypothetical protein AB1514_07195, partial [Pseudomonadota bacterium]